MTDTTSLKDGESHPAAVEGKAKFLVAVFVTMPIPMTLRGLLLGVALSASAFVDPASAQKLGPGQVYLDDVNSALAQRLAAMQRECHEKHLPDDSNYATFCAPIDKVEAVLGGFGCHVIDDPRHQKPYTWGCPKQAISDVRQVVVEKVLSAPSKPAPSTEVGEAPPISVLYQYQNMNYRRITAEDLLQMRSVLDGWCRGQSGGSALSDGACDERNRLDSALYAKGYCYVGMGSTGRFEKGPAAKWRRRGEEVMCR
jgi:hypothetical protein